MPAEKLALSVKKFSLFLFTLLLATSLHAQDKGQDLISEMAAQTCGCMENKVEPAMEKEAFMNQLKICFMSASILRKDEIEEATGLSYKKDIEKIVLKTVTEMMKTCPSTMYPLFSEAKKQSEAQKRVGSKGETKTTTITVKSLDEKQFMVLSGKNEAGEDMEFLWLQYFPGSDDLAKNASDLKGKNIQVEYEVKLLLDPESGDPARRNVIRGIIIR